MTINTITAATAAVKAALDNQAAAIAKARQAAADSHTAAAHMDHLEQRLTSGDASVDIAEMIDGKASAERLALLAGAYNDALPGYEAVIRQARTAETVAKVTGGAIRTYAQMAEYVQALAVGIADDLEQLMPELQAEHDARAAIDAGLPDTTAYGDDRYRFPHGEHSSPIKVARGSDRYEVDGTTYSTSLDVDRTLKDVLEAAEDELNARKYKRGEAARLAATARKQQAAKEQAAWDRNEREAAFTPTGGQVRYLANGRVVIDG